MFPHALCCTVQTKQPPHWRNFQTKIYFVKGHTLRVRGIGLRLKNTGTLL